MSHTPRTDATTIQVPVAVGLDGQDITHPMVPRHVARELERENADLQEEVIKANGLLDMQMKELAKLREDKERLDWLERKGPWDRWIDPDGPDITLRKPIRDCIDQFRKEAQP